MNSMAPGREVGYGIQWDGEAEMKLSSRNEEPVIHVDISVEEVASQQYPVVSDGVMEGRGSLELEMGVDPVKL